MNKISIIIFFLFITLSSKAQVDAIKIASAKKAIQNKDYKISLQILGAVSNTGRKSKMYLYYKGEAFYNLMEYDSAEVYYKKYLIQDINNSDVVDKLADIDYKKTKTLEAENNKKEIERKVVEKENCIKNCQLCQGTGNYIGFYYTTCEKCNGKGEACSYCNLTGKCKFCFAGYITNKDGSVQTCMECKGTNVCKKNHNCTSCLGTKTMKVKVQQKCHHPDCI